MDEQPNPLPGRVSGLAVVLEASEAWVGSMLARIGVEVELDGRFDTAAAQAALHRLASASPSDVGGYVGAEMGPSEESCRSWLIAKLAEHSVENKGRAGRRGARMTLLLPNGRQIRILTYVALRPKPSGQVGFTVNKLDDPGLDWIAFIAKPFGKAYLRRKTEILEGREKPDVGPPRTASLTFSAGSDADLLERRIDDMLRADTDWWEVNDGE